MTAALNGVLIVYLVAMAGLGQWKLIDAAFKRWVEPRAARAVVRAERAAGVAGTPGETR